MSSFGAAVAASTEQRPSVVSRETLWSGGIVAIRIPASVTPGSYPKDGKDIPFLQFSRCVRGGCVNLFVHTDDMSLRGPIVAGVSVMKKTLSDGREYLYVDLVPVENDVAVTHFLDIVSRGEREPSPDDPVFETLGHIDGLVILTPPKAPKPPKPRKPKSTGDSQLDRLLNQGWEIDTETPTVVRLFKFVGETMKTMQHHKPKQKPLSKRKR